jgi:hypothetical protein
MDLITAMNKAERRRSGIISWVRQMAALGFGVSWTLAFIHESVRLTIVAMLCMVVWVGIWIIHLSEQR